MRLRIREKLEKIMKALWLKIHAKISYLWTDIIYKACYIGSSEVLPPPLEPEEESKLLSQLNTDDGLARQTLIERNLRLVVYIARKFENTGICIEDLFSIGTIGLVKAVNTFDTSKNFKLWQTPSGYMAM